jgi:hypothetical protein
VAFLLSARSCKIAAALEIKPMELRERGDGNGTGGRMAWRMRRRWKEEEEDSKYMRGGGEGDWGVVPDS